jgi:hypothetical protein
MATSTVVVARQDLSIPGALEPNNAGINSPEQVENQFFNLLDQHKADAVVLDLMGSQGHGVAAIRRIPAGQRGADRRPLPGRGQTDAGLSTGRGADLHEPADRPDPA